MVVRCWLLFYFSLCVAPCLLFVVYGLMFAGDVVLASCV